MERGSLVWELVLRIVQFIVLKRQFTLWASYPQFVEDISVISKLFFFFSNSQSVASEVHFSLRPLPYILRALTLYLESLSLTFEEPYN